MTKPKPPGERRRPGPKPRAPGATTLVALRLTAVEREVYTAEADSLGQTLGAWIRESCLANLTGKHHKRILRQGDQS